MRKFSVGLLVLGLLMFAGQASADRRNNGTGDPKGLIASGAIQPFWNDGSNVALIVITSPGGDNTRLEAVFFDADCNRLISKPAGVTENGVRILDTEIPANEKGLAAIAQRTVGTGLQPAENPFHVFSLWINAAGDIIRVSDPISLEAAETKHPTQTWNPLRSGASFGAPIQGTTFSTEIFLICPSSDILDEVSWTKGFPKPPAIATQVHGVIYDWDENPLQDFHLACGCIAMYDLDAISPTYRDHVFEANAPQEFYTEIVTYVHNPRRGRIVTDLEEAESLGLIAKISPPSFYGFRAITVTDPLLNADDWTRLNNGSAAAYQGQPFVGAR